MDNDIQLILEYKNSFGKYHPVFLKNPYREFFLGHSVYILLLLLGSKQLIMIIISISLSRLKNNEDI